LREDKSDWSFKKKGMMQVEEETNRRENCLKMRSKISLVAVLRFEPRTEWLKFSDDAGWYKTHKMS
jgi:hypothetical protein